MLSGSRSILLAALAAVALGCTSPTLPLPPPAAPTETQVDATTIRLDGAYAVAGAYIIVENDNLAYTGQKIVEATIVSDTGTWTITITAAKPDILKIDQIAGDQTSSTTFQVH